MLAEITKTGFHFVWQSGIEVEVTNGDVILILPETVMDSAEKIRLWDMDYPEARKFHKACMICRPNDFWDDGNSIILIGDENITVRYS